MRKLLYLFIVLSCTSCSILYPSMMLKTPRNYAFNKLNDSISTVDYKISPNDFISMRLFSQDGFKLVDMSNILESSGESNTSSGNNFSYITTGVEYMVESDGTLRLPVIGWVNLLGMTLREATQILEQKYSQYYIKPYILLKATNRRVFVFPGDPGTAKVIPLLNNNTTLIEALALTGGITESGKAKQIKLIRGNPNKPEVYLIDLSTINGIKDGSTVLQEGDIIYVTPQIRPAASILERISPTLTLISTIILTIALVNNTKL